MSRNNHRSSLFLLELILAIFFFSLAAAGCIQLYADAYTTQRRTSQLAHAVPLAESACSAFQAADGDLSVLSSLFPEGRLSADGSSFSVSYDEDWNPLEADSSELPAYLLSITPEPQEEHSSLISARIRISQGSETVYELTASRQIPRTVPAQTGGTP